MLLFILNLLHFILLFSPILIYFIPIKYLQPYFKYIFLLIILIPLHWIYFDGQCFATIISKKYGDMENTQTTSGFSETYLKWLYKPIMNLFKWEWNTKGLDKMINTHWIVNYILVWYYLFFVGGKKLI